MLLSDTSELKHKHFYQWHEDKYGAKPETGGDRELSFLAGAAHAFERSDILVARLQKENEKLKSQLASARGVIERVARGEFMSIMVADNWLKENNEVESE